MASSTTFPAKQTAIISPESRTLGISHDVDIPKLLPNTLPIKTVAIAINPVDVKMQGPLATPGSISDFDFSGRVVAIGSEIKRDFKIGDRVCGAVVGQNPLSPGVGSFSQYLTITEHTLFKMHDSMSFEEAASLGVGIETAGLALFHSLKIPATVEKPAQKPSFVLVYGGSTATGTLCIQLLKMCGLKPVVTCSEKNFALVESYGADKAFDYHSPTCTADIRVYTKNSLKYTVDCITNAASMGFYYAVIGRTGGRYCGLEPYPEYMHTRPTIKPDWVLSPWG